jgi:hypothetical protein
MAMRRRKNQPGCIVKVSWKGQSEKRVHDGQLDKVSRKERGGLQMANNNMRHVEKRNAVRGDVLLSLYSCLKVGCIQRSKIKRRERAHL